MSDPHQEHERPEQSDLTRTLKDLFAGAVGGVAQVLLGQPFDIVKVRLQTTSQYSGALDAATKIYQTEGALAFYKGTLTLSSALVHVYLSSLEDFTTPGAPLRLAIQPTQAIHSFRTASTTQLEPLPVSPIRFFRLPLSTFASGCKRNHMARRDSTTDQLIASARFLHNKACFRVSTAAQL